MYAASVGDVKLVERLLAVKGVKVNTTNFEGHTALYLAAYEGYEKIVNLLLAAKGIDVNCADIAGSTALSIAAYLGHEKIVEQLLAVKGVKLPPKRGHEAAWKTIAFVLFKSQMKAGDISQATKSLKLFYENVENKNTEILKLYRTLLDDPKPDWAGSNLSEIDAQVLKLTKKNPDVNQALHVLIGRRLLQDASKGGVTRNITIELLKEALEHASSAPKAEGAKELAGNVTEKLAELNVKESEIKPAMGAVETTAGKSRSWPEFFKGKSRGKKAVKGTEKESLVKRRPSDPGQR